MKTSVIRSYEQKDARQIVRLYYETIRSVNRADYSQEQVEAWAPDIPDAAVWHRRMASHKTLVAEENNEIIGFAELEEGGCVDTFFVRRDAVGRGVGRRLYMAVEKEARSRGIEKIFTEASITARPFFERQGFRVVCEQTLQRQGIGLTNFVMEKSLDQ